MIREQVLIQTIPVTKRQQQVFFQLKLPRDTHKIIGVETGLSVIQADPQFFVPSIDAGGVVRRNLLMGTLQLQANGSTDVFYSKDIFERDINTGLSEIKQFITQQQDVPPLQLLLIEVPLDGNGFEFYNCWSHGRKREEDPLSICNCSVISGWFKDAAYATINTDIIYQVTLYIWIERKIKSLQ
jgi:hypothetical protein